MTKPNEFRMAMKNPNKRCPIPSARAAMTPTQRRAFDAAMRDATITCAAIYDVLKKWGTPIGRDAAARHRKGRCSCGI